MKRCLRNIYFDRTFYSKNETLFQVPCADLEDTYPYVVRTSDDRNPKKIHERLCLGHQCERVFYNITIDQTYTGVLDSSFSLE